jgi:hypothetical protein
LAWLSNCYKRQEYIKIGQASKKIGEFRVSIRRSNIPAKICFKFLKQHRNRSATAAQLKPAFAPKKTASIRRVKHHTRDFFVFKNNLDVQFGSDPNSEISSRRKYAFSPNYQVT